MNNLLLKVPHCFEDVRFSALCIITRSSGSAPGKIGAKMIVYSDGTIEGTVGGGAIEKKTIEDALEVIRTQTPKMTEYNLLEDLSMTCGGLVSVYIEPISKPSKLYIFGAGHIGKYLANLTPGLGFDTTLIDWRNYIFEEQEKVEYKQMCMPYLDAVEKIDFNNDTYCVIVTPGHEMDEEVLAEVGKKTTAYVGMIGSKTKIAKVKKIFIENNTLTEEEIARVDMPIGIKFNALTPEEISISILAKLIDVKNNKTQNK